MSSQPYTHFRLIARKLYGNTYNLTNQNSFSMKELTISGIQEGTNTISVFPPSPIANNPLYVATQSRYPNNPDGTPNTTWLANRLFDKSFANNTAYFSFGGYNSSGITTTSSRSVVDNQIVTGEWVQIQMPVRIYITSINLIGREISGYNGCLAQHIMLAGSNNGLQWTTIYENINQPYENIYPLQNNSQCAFTTIDLTPYTLYLNPKEIDTLKVLFDAYTDLSANGTNRALVNYDNDTTSQLIPSANINLITGNDVIKFIAVSNRNRIIYNYSYENEQRLDNFTYYIVFSIYENADIGAKQRSLFVGTNTSNLYITNSLLVTISDSSNNIFINNIPFSNSSLTVGIINFLIVSVDLSGTTRCILNTGNIVDISNTTRVGFSSFCISGFYANNTTITSATAYDRIYEVGIFEQDMFMNSNDLLNLKGYLIKKYFFPRSIINFKSNIITSTNDIYFNDTSFNITGGSAPTQYNYYTDLSNYPISTLNFSYSNGIYNTLGTLSGISYNVKFPISSITANSKYAFIETVNNRFNMYTTQYLIEDEKCILNRPVIRHVVDGSINADLYIKVDGEFIKDIAIRIYDIQDRLIIGPRLFNYNGGDIEYFIGDSIIRLNTGYFVSVTASNNINKIEYKKILYITGIQETSAPTTSESVEYVFQNRQINTNTNSATNVQMISDISNIYIAQQRGSEIIVSVLSKPGLDQFYDYYRFIFPSIYDGTKCAISNISISGQLFGTTTRYELPPTDMTTNSQNITTITAISGTYISSSSSNNTNSNAWKAFSSSSANFWESANNRYLYGDYILNQTIQLNGRTICGEWLQLQLPHKFKLSSIKAFANKINNGIYTYDPGLPEKIIICGSNDGLNWNEVFSTSLLERKGDLGQEYISITNIEPYASQYVLNNAIISGGTYTLNSIACGVADGKNYLFIGDTSGQLNTLTDVVVHRYELPDLINLTIFNTRASTSDDLSGGLNTISGEETNLQLVYNSTNKLLYCVYQCKVPVGSTVQNIYGNGFGNNGFYNIFYSVLNPLTGIRAMTKSASITTISTTGKDCIITSSPVINHPNIFFSYSSGIHEYKIVCISGISGRIGTPAILTISGYNAYFSSVAAFNKDLIYVTYENTFPENNRKFIVVNPISVNSSATTLTSLQTFLKLYDENNIYDCANPSIICAPTTKRLFISYETKGKTSLNTFKSTNNETDIAIACINIDSSQNLLLDNILHDKSLNSWGENKLSTLYYDSTIDRLYCTWLTNSSTVGNFINQTNIANYDVANAQIKYTIIPENKSIYQIGGLQNNGINTISGYNYKIRATLIYGSFYYICHTINTKDSTDIINNLYITKYTLSTQSSNIANNTILTNPVQIKIIIFNKVYNKVSIIGITEGNTNSIIIAFEVIDDINFICIGKIPENFDASSTYTISQRVTISGGASNPQLMLYSTNYIYCLYDVNSSGKQEVYLASLNYSLVLTNFPSYSGFSNINLSTKIGTTAYGNNCITIKASMYLDFVYHLYFNNNTGQLILWKFSGNITSTSEITNTNILSNNYNVYNYITGTDLFACEDFIFNTNSTAGSVYLYVTFLKQFGFNTGIQNIIVQLEIVNLTARQTQLLTTPFKSTSNTLNTHLGLITNNFLFCTFNTKGNTGNNYTLDPTQNDIVLARIDISGMGSSGSTLAVSDIIQHRGFNTFDDDFNPFINIKGNVIIIAYNTTGTISNGSRITGSSTDSQIAFALFNIGNLPLTLTPDIKKININYGLYKKSRIVIKSNNNTIINVGLTNN